jgi:hypothetical protein
MNASHLLRYSTLKPLKGQSGADFVDGEHREYIALREIGRNVTLYRTTSLFETSRPAEQPAESSAPSINTFSLITATKTVIRWNHDEKTKKTGVLQIKPLKILLAKDKGSLAPSAKPRTPGLTIVLECQKSANVLASLGEQTIASLPGDRIRALMTKMLRLQ